MVQKPRLLEWLGHGNCRCDSPYSYVLDGRYTGYKLVGMAMSKGMFVGMGLIVAGIASAAYGLLPSERHESLADISISPPRGRAA